MQQLLINSEESEITILDRLLAAQIGVQKLLQTWSVKQVCSISNTLSQFWCNFQQLSDVKGGFLRGIVNYFVFGLNCCPSLLYFNLNESQFLQTMLAIYGLHSIKKLEKITYICRKNCNSDHFVSFINCVNSLSSNGFLVNTPLQISWVT